MTTNPLSGRTVYLIVATDEQEDEYGAYAEAAGAARVHYLPGVEALIGADAVLLGDEPAGGWCAEALADITIARTLGLPMYAVSEFETLVSV